jgi:TRAP-type transport system small permease protein
MTSSIENRAVRASAKIERVIDSLCICMLVAMVASMGWQVFGRYVLNHSPAWSEELARYLMVWLTFLGSASVLRSGGHLTVTALVDALPPTGQRMLLWIRDLLMMGLCVLMAVQSWRFAIINLGQETAALEIPMAVPNLALAVGFGLIALQIILCRLAGEPFKAIAGDEF